MPERPASDRKALVRMVLVALVLRLVVVAFIYPERLNPDRNYWRFAGEAGRIAESVLLGHGYGNPFFGLTGPTAWMPPAYPSLVAAVFWVFGVYTKASALMLLSLNSLFSALTCLPVFHLARIGFGLRAANWAGWTWAFFPYAVYFSADFIWPTTLTTLLLSVLTLWILKLEEDANVRSAFLFGIVAGIAGLTDPIVLAALVPLAVCICLRRVRAARPWSTLALAMSMGFALLVTPWFVRNYEVFHTFVPFRDNFGLELYIGNHGDAAHFAPVGVHPSTSTAELKAYTELGERAYLEEKERLALDFIAAHPLWFLEVTLRRVLYMWTSFWSFDAGYRKQEPFDLPNVALSTLLDIVALAGLYRAFRNHNGVAIPFALVLLFFPMVYYVTHWEDYYRRPIDPIFVVLAVYEVWARVTQRQRAPAAA